MVELFPVSPTYTCLFIAGVSYLALVRRLRFQRRDAVQRRYPHAKINSMTLDEAFEIQSNLAVLEFPTIFFTSIFFALFKTYGIPSISKLLVATGQLSDESTASKRAADTGVILSEVFLHHPSDSRAIDGIARMNYLHRIYRKSGKISDEDMLYTLSLFALEPIRWTRQYEWREVSDVERCAMGIYWRYMADAMEIPLTALRSSPAEWRDGLHFLNDLEGWRASYEADAMVPAETNWAVAKGTIDIGLFNVPRCLHSIVLAFVSIALQPHVRRAMLFPDPPQWAVIVLNSVIEVRRFLIRYAFPPRPYFLRDRWWSETPNKHGRFNAKQFVSLPWYIEPTITWRWGLKAWLLWAMGSKLPGDDGDKYQPKGYIISQLGPEGLKAKARQDVQCSVRDKTLPSSKTSSFHLTYFYSAAPIVYRMSSAAFFNIGNFTSNIWGAAVGTSVFGIHIHWMYYNALVVILLGHGVYYGTQGVLGDSAKPWLGPAQEGGSDGLGTARRQLENADVNA